MKKKQSPEDFFLVAYSLYRFSEEYASLLNACRGSAPAYTNLLGQHLRMSLSSLFGRMDAEESCMEDLRKRCEAHPAFSGGENAEPLSQLDALCRRYELLFSAGASGTVADAVQLVADTAPALKAIGCRLFNAAPEPAGCELFERQCSGI